MVPGAGVPCEADPEDELSLHHQGPGQHQGVVQHAGWSDKTLARAALHSTALATLQF